MKNEREELLDRIAELEQQVENLRRAMVGDLIYQPAMSDPVVGTYRWWVDSDQVWWSEGLYEILGYDKDLQAPCTDAFKARIHPDDIDEMNQGVRQVRETKSMAWNQVARIVRPSGELRYVLMTGSVELDESGQMVESLGVVVDFTDEIDADLTSERSNWTVKEAQAIAEIGLWSFEIEPEILTFGGDLHKLLGIPIDEEPSVRKHKKLVHPDDLKKLNFSHLENGQREIVDIRMRTTAGEEKHLRVTAIMTGEGARRQLRGAVVDVTDANRLREEQRKAAQLESLSTLAQGLAHDLGNHMMVIAHTVDSLEFTSFEGMDELRDSVAAASLLTGRIVAVAQDQAARMAPADTSLLVTECERAVRRIVQPGVELDVELDPNVPLIRCDARRIGDALINLIKNACEAVPTHGRVVVSTSVIESDDRAFAVLSVDDDGPGVGVDDLNKIFDPFYSTKGRGEGAGLGLWMVASAAKSHGGEVVVTESTLGGARFEIWLPVGPTIQASAIPTPTVVPTSVLVVDDQPAVARVIARLLRRDGHEVFVATNSEEVESVIREHGGEIRVAIIDLVLRDTDGVALGRRLRDELPKRPVLVHMSGHGASESVEGVFLQKPFNAGALRFAVAEALEGS